MRAGLVKRPEEWPFDCEMFYDKVGGSRVARGMPPLLDVGMLIEENDGRTSPRENEKRWVRARSLHGGGLT